MRCAQIGARHFTSHLPIIIHVKIYIHVERIILHNVIRLTFKIYMSMVRHAETSIGVELNLYAKGYVFFLQ